MKEYSAPTSDMMFVLEHVIGLAELARLPQFADVDLDVVPDLLDEGARFFADVLSPLNRSGDVQGAVRHDDGSVRSPDGFSEAYQRYVEAGWGGMSFDPEYGGGGLPWVVGTAIAEMITAANLSFALNVILSHGSIHALEAHCTEEEKLAWIPKLISGEWTSTMNLTEAQAGSDVGALTTRAVRQEDGHYRITGQKIFITWGEHDLAENIVHLVLARTPGAPPGTRGISLFLVPKHLVNEDGSLGERNEIHCVSIEHKMGIHASPTCVLQFGGEKGAVGYLIGGENAGMRCMFTMMNQARLSVGLQGLALSDRAYQQALDYAQEREQGSRPDTPRGGSVAIIEHPDVRRMLMTMKAYIEAMRCLAYLNAYSIDVALHHPDPVERQRGQELADLLTPLSKGWCTDVGNEVTSLGVQIHGGMGYVEEAGAAQYFRDMRIGAIYEGTNGIQAIDLVGRKLSMRDGDAVKDLVAEIDATIAELRRVGLEEIAAPLEAATVDLRAASAWLLERGGATSDDGLAGATPYLRLFGTTVGGWLLGRSALAARGLLEAGQGDRDFLDAKIVTARFFATQLLPQVHGLMPAIQAGAGDLYAIEVGSLR